MAKVSSLPLDVLDLPDVKAWRVGYKPEPWCWVDWRWATGGKFNGRWDDSTGQFRTDYAGETLVACLVQHGTALWAHVGDSRLYRLREGVLTQLTRDHSHVQDLVDAGLLTPEQARVAPNRNLVTRAVGIAALVQVVFKA